MSETFEQRLKRVARDAEDRLQRWLAPQDHVPARLVDAMRHGALAGGKRLRPFLLVESARLFGTSPDNALDAGCALELVHCYSLVHDDLPAMDDDDLRRGRPTVHKAYDEATAILAGDALLTLAFERLAEPSTHDDPAIRIELVALLAKAAGQAGMIGGQMLDIAAEMSPPDEAGILQLQSMKTGALLRFACEAGAVLGRASVADRGELVAFGDLLGIAFQLTDDLLDVTSSAERMGKAVGKDEAVGKATLVAQYGVDGTRDRLRRIEERAIAHLANIEADTDMLHRTLDFVIRRDH